MNWLEPALAFMGLASTALAGTFFYLWLGIIRRRYVLLWALAWLVSLPHLAITWRLLETPGDRGLWTAQQISLTVNALLMAGGCYEFVQRRLPVRTLFLVALPFLAWAVVAPHLSSAFFELMLPGSLLLGGSYLWTAHRFLILRRERGVRGAGITAVLFAIAGLHEFDYPILGALHWAAPIGFALASMLALTISLFLLIIVLEDARDETQRQRARAAAVLENLPVGVLVTSGDGTVLDMNEAARTLGLEDSVVEGRWSAEREARRCRSLDGSPSPPELLPLARALASGTLTAAQELSLENADGRSCAVLVHAGPVRDERGRLIGAVTVYQDIDALKRIQAEIGRAEKLHDLGILAAGVAHDFNNALTLILGHSDLALRHADAAAVHPQLEIIRRAALDSAAVVRRIQDVARSRTHRDRVTFDMAQLVHEVVELSQPRWRNEAESRGLHYQIECRLDPGCTLAGQPTEMREAILNMVLNAIDAMPQGGTLRFACWRAGEEVLLRVSDTGVGMTAERRARIFDPFFTTKGTAGTGLGLAVVYGIVQRHGGHIEVESEPGVGSTFQLRFPFHGTDGVEERGTADPGVGRRVLVVDDDAEVRTLTVSMLVAAGHQVVAVAGGVEALDTLVRDRPDIVLTDLGMPGMNGWQLAEAIRQLGFDTPTVLVTGWGDSVPAEDLARHGVDHVLAKPFVMDDLIACVSRLTIARRAA